MYVGVYAKEHSYTQAHMPSVKLWSAMVDALTFYII